MSAVRLRALARLLALLGAVLMPASLFLDWYEVEASVFGESSLTFHGWQVFEVTDAVMVLVAIVVVGLAVAEPPNTGRLMLLLGTIATVFILVGLIDKPAIYGLVDTPGLSLRIGAWLGLAGALMVVAAGLTTAPRPLVPR